MLAPLIKRIIISFILLLANTAICQKPLPRIVTALEFLDKSPKGAFYDIETDSLGYAYIASGKKIQRFNGSKLVDLEYKKNHGGEVIIGLDKDFYGRIWAVHHDSEISYIEGDQIVNYPIDKPIDQFNNVRISRVYRDSLKSLYIATEGIGCFEIKKNGAVIHHDDESNKINGYIVKQLADGHWFLWKQNSISTDSLNPQKRIPSLYYQDEKNVNHKICELSEEIKRFENTLVAHSDGSVSFSSGDKHIVRFNKTQLIEQHEFHTKVIKLFLDRDDDLWIGTIDQGFYRAKNGDFATMEHFSQGSTAVVAESHNGGLWLTSNVFGFGYIAPNSFDHYSEQNGCKQLSQIYSLVTYGDSILVQNQEGELFILYDHLISEFNPPGIGQIQGKEYWYSLPDAMRYDTLTKNVWISYAGCLQYWDGTNWGIVNFDDSTFVGDYTENLILTKDGRLIGHTKHEIYEVVNHKIERLSKPIPSNIQSIKIDAKDRIWVSGYNGVWLLNEGELVRPQPNLPETFYKRSNAILSALNRVWVHNADHLYVQDNDTFKVLHNDNGSSLGINNYSISPDGHLWFCSNKLGMLYEIHLLNNRLKVNQYKLNLNDVSVSNIANGLLVTREDVFFGTNKGLFVEKIENLKGETENPIATFTDIKINKNTVPIQSRYELDYNENSFIFSFDGISYRPEELIYRYRLKEIDPIWTETSFTDIQFTNLEPGTYHFMIRVGHSNKEWSKIKTITLVIAKPYWEKWWFILAMVLLLISILFLLFKIRVRNIKKKEQEKAAIALELSQLELRSLKSQINPHFIFNSITSVMNYLSEKEKEKAESYLQRFAQIMRRILENSEENTVFLNDEIRLMQQYINLETEQYEGSEIELIIITDRINSEKIKIPPSLLQPYIENAIRHGLKNKPGNRSIILDFDIEEDLLKIVIEDNGIGRKAAAQNDTRKNHKSFGMLISSRRIEILNKKKLNNVIIKDLYDVQNNPIGTRVTLNIPIEKK